MTLTQTIGEITDIKTILEDSFVDNRNKREIVDNEDEYAWIKDGHYFLENKSESTWMYYTKPVGTSRENDFIIDATMIPLRKGEFNNYGLVWGFEKEPERLNRFTVDNATGRITIASFWREDGSETIRRYSSRSEKINRKEGEQNRLVIIKIGLKIFFFVNDINETVFETDAGSFSWTGDRAGFYTEPGMIVTVKNIRIKKLNVKSVKNNTFTELILRKN